MIVFINLLSLLFLKKKQRVLLRFLGYPWFKEHVFYLLNLLIHEILFDFNFD